MDDDETQLRRWAIEQAVQLNGPGFPTEVSTVLHDADQLLRWVTARRDLAFERGDQASQPDWRRRLLPKGGS